MQNQIPAASVQTGSTCDGTCASVHLFKAQFSVIVTEFHNHGIRPPVYTEMQHE